ncbi:MAG: biotin--[acetyl-CoA-carboxylase] ligase [Candidatus Melainabacteria bacterium]
MHRYTHATLDSTNDEARRLIAAWQQHPGASTLAPEPFAVIADAQTAGRGTKGRQWVSPPGAGLYLSVVHPVGTVQTALPLTTNYTVAAGVACVEALQALYGLTVQIKPVNDLMHDGRKLGGILTEGIIQDNRLQCVITGIGINLLKADRPVKKHTPVSLEELTNQQEFPKDPLVDAITNRLNHWYAHLADSPTDTLPDELDLLYHSFLRPRPPSAVASDTLPRKGAGNISHPV